jgi:hypothetical protein
VWGLCSELQVANIKQENEKVFCGCFCLFYLFFCWLIYIDWSNACFQHWTCLSSYFKKIIIFIWHKNYARITHEIHFYFFIITCYRGRCVEKRSYNNWTRQKPVEINVQGFNFYIRFSNSDSENCLEWINIYVKSEKRRREIRCCC